MARRLRHLATLALIVLLAGCTETSLESGSGDAVEPASDPAPMALETALGPCEPPSTPNPDPLTLLHRAPYKKAHFQDVDVEAERGLIFVAGLPGLIAYQDTGGEPAVISRYPPAAANGTKKNNRDYQHLEVVSDSLVALTNRGVKKPGQMGVHLIDTTDPADMNMWPLVTVPAAAGLVAHGDLLYVLSHEGALYAVDLSDLDRAHEDPKRILDGLGNPWEIVVVGQRAYVADNSLGLVTIDISVPEEPKLVEITPSSGGPQDLVADGTTLYVASGLVGVEIFDISEPDAPSPLAIVDVGGPVISVAVADGLLYTADHDGVAVIDVSSPEAPQPLGFEATPSWAMHVSAHEDRLFLADWNALSVFRADSAVRAPEARLNREQLYLLGDTTVTTFELSNRGGAPLVISGSSVEDERLSLGFDRLVIPPGEMATGYVSLETSDVELDSGVCIATDDPDQPIQTLQVSSFSTGSSVGVGDLAPDFTLQDLDGDSWTLSEQRGRPVILCYFATW